MRYLKAAPKRRSAAARLTPSKPVHGGDERGLAALDTSENSRREVTGGDARA